MIRKILDWTVVVLVVLVCIAALAFGLYYEFLKFKILLKYS